MNTSEGFPIDPDGVVARPDHFKVLRWTRVRKHVMESRTLTLAYYSGRDGRIICKVHQVIVQRKALPQAKPGRDGYAEDTATLQRLERAAAFSGG